MNDKNPIQAYPLSWPAGWPRAKPEDRKRAQFKNSERQYSEDGGLSWMRHSRISVTDGVDRCLRELARLGVDRQDVVVSTNMPTRLDGLPRSGSSEPKDPGAAVYWIPADGAKRTPKVMAVDIYDRLADNLAAIAATLEAMRAIERHGGAQILERAFTGFTQLPAPVAVRHWRQVFGFAEDEQVTPLRLQGAYRTARSDTHPDRGGDAAAFQEVQRAYEDACAEIGE